MEPKDSQHESGWWEVLRVIGILGVGAVVIVAALMFAHTVASKKKSEFNEDAVTAEISAASSKCTPEFPLEVTLTNVSGKDALNVGFQVRVADAGHSTVYYTIAGSGMGTDRIIPPQHTYRDCYRMPPFHIGENNPTPAAGIPDTLAAPQYSVVVTGVRLRGED